MKPKLMVFASNVADFDNAMRAKQDSGPLDNCFSTPSIEAVSNDQFGEFCRIEKAYPEHRVFRSKDCYVHYQDERGNKYIPP